MNTINVLLIEDRPEDAELTMVTLKELPFIDPIQWIRDGEEALDFLFKKGKYTSQKEPDLILLDLDLSGLSGIDILEQIRQTPQTESIPVIIVSAPLDETLISKAYDKGANSFLPKPLVKEQLTEVLTMLGFNLS